MSVTHGSSFKKTLGKASESPGLTGGLDASTDSPYRNSGTKRGTFRNKSGAKNSRKSGGGQGARNMNTYHTLLKSFNLDVNQKVRLHSPTSNRMKSSFLI